MDVTVSHHKARSESTLICFDQYTSSYLICGPHSFAHSQCKLICLRFSSCFFRSNSTRFHYTLFFSVVIFNSSATFFPLQQEAANYSSRKFITKNYDSNNYFDVSSYKSYFPINSSSRMHRRILWNALKSIESNERMHLNVVCRWIVGWPKWTAVRTVYMNENTHTHMIYTGAIFHASYLVVISYTCWKLAKTHSKMRPQMKEKQRLRAVYWFFSTLYTLKAVAFGIQQMIYISFFSVSVCMHGT